MYSTTLHALKLLANGIAWCSFVRYLCLKPGMWLVGCSGMLRKYSLKWNEGSKSGTNRWYLVSLFNWCWLVRFVATKIPVDHFGGFQLPPHPHHTLGSISVWRLSFSGSTVTSCMYVCHVVCCFQTWYPRSIIMSTSNLATTRTPKLSPLRLWVSMAPSMVDPLDMLLQVRCYSDTRCYGCETENYFCW